MERRATIKRKTKETDIQLELNLDGNGRYEIDTGIPFMDHMLGLFAAHGFLDLQITAKGDTEIDYHHTVEDLGICLGKALEDALGEKKGIRRFGESTLPMDEALARVVIDISNRPALSHRVSAAESKTGNFDINLIREFFRAMVNYSGMTLHIDLISGDDPHHIAEAIFKAFGRALDKAVSVESRLQGSVPSTKGVL
ncbi:MAG: imidazoleglycerol-phosphate dehydratase HisB [Deltaproteobacteria bacterium]|nr:imidazoleglycerol-phosphate dehydratase HisB [Deltaproteobacteria bacterium]MBW1941385.1 imidazoleglycerol-phosphate dehydratase HisB [Deltaproteobacteria bacterium]MBW2205418.1 imidazoleglycerol-phosphate dehydratase HisB [Deltaproteobacteria bacterium]